jgi:hypothetical protein
MHCGFLVIVTMIRILWRRTEPATTCRRIRGVATSVSSSNGVVLMRYLEARGHFGDRPRGVEFDDV